MKKFILISVCDREIMTEIFDSYEEAVARRNEEIEEDIGTPAEEINANEEYEDKFCYVNRYEASTIHNHDWLIVEIPMKQEEI